MVLVEATPQYDPKYAEYVKNVLANGTSYFLVRSTFMRIVSLSQKTMARQSDRCAIFGQDFSP